MINRSYLPFKSARLYADRKMAKWMGFFLSEHTSALHCDNGNTIKFTHSMALDEKLLLLSQAYIHHLRVTIILKETLHTGEIIHLTPAFIGLRADRYYYQIKITDVLSLQLADQEEIDE
ncbi:hypothetical protein [Tuanshanicoccus lijuaniae]|uniref:hypothetical protein n=1 Tax=Aerococcaceae bacterium zg-1292 TaxID=2774330 RepID=UPI001BD83B23|nr:hypothetical protein [Aerococcaceae bacterium zg-A91]MBS4457993.1 hypothetical protein [Aerococcaceae bacterium zg-BR33]